jgi:hypothetical protein
VRPNKRIDPRLSSVQMPLPGSRGPSPGLPNDGLQSLPARTMTRHINFGLRLGPVGARIVGEVFVGLLKEDSGSYLRAAMDADAAVAPAGQLPHGRPAAIRGRGHAAVRQRGIDN